MNYIWHVALGIGRGTREARPSWSPAEAAEWLAHLRRAVTDPTGAPIPGHDGYRAAARLFGAAALVTVGRARDQTGLCTIGLCAESRPAAKLWQSLHDGYPWFDTSRGDVPRAPYCAVRPEAGLLDDAAAGDWIDAYQIAIAWTWLDNRASLGR